MLQIVEKNNITHKKMAENDKIVIKIKNNDNIVIKNEKTKQTLAAKRDIEK